MIDINNLFQRFCVNKIHVCHHFVILFFCVISNLGNKEAVLKKN